jgi:DNA-cytosine methyltransferase
VHDCVDKYLARIKIINQHRERLMELLRKKNEEFELTYVSDDEEFEMKYDYDSEDESIIQNGVPDSKDYLVEKIVDARISKKNKEKLDYEVKWEGWADKYNEWIFEEDLNCFELLYKFIKKHPMKDEIDFIFGGPPCQSFSSRNRNRTTDLSDSRNSLVLQFLNFVDYFKPKYFLIENVTGVLSAIEGIEQKIRSVGYDFKVGIICAAHFKTPQKRNRVFIWGCQKGLQLPEYPKNYNSAIPLKSTMDKKFYYTIHNPYIMRAGYLPPVNLWDILSDLPPASAETKLHSYAMEPQNIYQSYYRSNCTTISNHNCGSIGNKVQRWIDHVPNFETKPGASWKDLPEEIKDEIGDGYKNYRKGIHMLKRLRFDSPCPTVLTSPQPMSENVTHPMENRTLTIRECARIQGFKDNFEFVGSDKDCYKQIGNAVAVPVARHMGEMLVDVYFNQNFEKTPQTHIIIEKAIPVDLDEKTMEYNEKIFEF